MAILWPFLVYEISGLDVTALAVVWALTAADALAVVVGKPQERIRLYSSRWERFPETMTATVRFGSTTRTLRATHAPDLPPPPMYLWAPPYADGAPAAKHLS